jgi:hypothetical protein
VQLFGYQPLLLRLQATESRGSRSTDCEGAETENEVSYQHVLNIVLQRFVYKNVQHNKIIFVQTTIEGNQEKN